MSLKVLKATSYLNDVIIDKNLKSIKYYGTLRRYNWATVSQFYEKSMRCTVNVM